MNSTISSWFRLEHGCRQEDPISPYIFQVVTELLVHMIRHDRNIKGYKIKGLDITISQYADDTSLFLDGSERSLKHCLDALQKFARYSGLRINQGKTRGFWFGCPRPQEDTMLPDTNINKHMNEIRTKIES